MRIYIYRLDKCGIYRSDEDDTPEFGALTEWWPEFLYWVRAKGDYKATCTFTNDKKIPPRVYCVGSAADGDGNVGVALWNEAPADARGVASLPPEGEPGNLRAEFQNIREGSKPGWARYFWFMPEEGIAVALAPDNLGAYRGPGMSSATEYFYNYLRWHSGYARVREVERDPGQITKRLHGFSRTIDDDPDGELKARFKTSQLKTTAPLQEIRNKVGEIRKYIVNSTVEIPRHDHRGALHRFLDSVMPFARRDCTEDIQKNFRMELDWEPDEQALQQAINDWNQHEAGDNYWVGVKFKNDGRIHRFDEAVGRSSVELTDGWVNEPLWGEENLLSAWTTARPKIGHIINRP
ncbi:hypothetical protein [Rubrobacter indicoceani]|uniref:hypothetical protein n=1 Tax=Rubrobacter indicoceani TaxID=2051957 RepID=UPI000E5A90D7|nr:hypothetical protein [Rubrobacter indicoceani]